ncbi:MAG: hypothetical protein Q4E50_02275, partial [Tissierellia bacterium]|nr:hypothetical protein [Tissierellia bacterium]
VNPEGPIEPEEPKKSEKPEVPEKNDGNKPGQSSEDDGQRKPGNTESNEDKVENNKKDQVSSAKINPKTNDFNQTGVLTSLIVASFLGLIIIQRRRNRNN